jgi:hypothetical protein
MLGPFLFLGFFAVSVVYSAWRGGVPERWAAALLLVGLIASASAGVIQIQGAFHGLSLPLAIVDTVLAFALVLLALLANRIWVIPLASCQIAAALGHFAKLVAPDIVPLGYAFLVSIWGWPMTALLAFGAWCHNKRAMTGYLDRPWRPSSRLRRTLASI